MMRLRQPHVSKGDNRYIGAQCRMPKSTTRRTPQIRMKCEEENEHVLPMVENAMYPFLDITMTLYESTHLQPQTQEEAYNQTRVVKELLALLRRTATLGEDANVRLSKKYGGGTCLHLATLTGSLECVRILVSAGARIEAKDANRQTPLHWAANSAPLSITQFLCKANKSLAQQLDIQGNLPIHYAAQRGDFDSFRYLSKFSSLHCVGHNQKTLLHMACQRGAMNIILHLLDAAADPSACSTQGTTALHYAASRGDVQAVKVLVNVAPNVARVRDGHGRTPLALAFHRGTLNDEINRLLTPHARSPSPRSVRTHKSPRAASRSVSPRSAPHTSSRGSMRTSQTPRTSSRPSMRTSQTPRTSSRGSMRTAQTPRSSSRASMSQAKSTPSMGTMSQKVRQAMVAPSIRERVQESQKGRQVRSAPSIRERVRSISPVADMRKRTPRKESAPELCRASRKLRN